MTREERMWKSENARKRRKSIKELRDGLKERLFSKLRRQKKKK